jgi:dipeptidyl aminopeptidase/acylaminoacyl peptidase
VTYARPSVAAEEALPEAQFIDEGGPVRIFWMEDDRLRLWVLAAGTWTIAPADGAVSEAETDLPVLWSPRGNRRVTVAEEGTTTTMTLLDGGGESLAVTTIEGLVSHLRWSPDGDRVVFTVGRSASAGGVLQDLFLWDLGDGEAPVQLTATGAAFSAEWLGTTPLWRG